MNQPMHGTGPIEFGFYRSWGYKDPGVSIIRPNYSKREIENVCEISKGNLIFEKAVEGSETPPLFTASMQDLQSLYISLGDFLSRENKIPMNEGFEAQEKHLQDMRKIVFKQLKIEDK